MNEAANRFEIFYKEEKIKVQRHSVISQTIFRIVFSDKSPIVITCATHENGYIFWTSIPEGRQREAEEIGKLIEEFYKTK